MDERRAVRLTAAVLVAGTASAISGAAHALGGGMTHPAALTAALAVLLVAPTYAVLGARRRPARLFSALAGGQAALHLTWATLDRADPSAARAPMPAMPAGLGADPMHALTHPPAGPAYGGLAMLAWHAAATVLTVALALHAERAVRCARSWLTARLPGAFRLRPPVRYAVPTRPGPARTHRSPAACRPRGPPVVLR